MHNRKLEVSHGPLSKIVCLDLSVALLSSSDSVRYEIEDRTRVEDRTGVEEGYELKAGYEL